MKKYLNVNIGVSKIKNVYFQVGTSNEYEQIFKRIIIELQRCQDNYEEMLAFCYVIF